MATGQSWRCLCRWMIPFTLLGLLSCAYYNTFFVAKKSFRKAEESVRQSRSGTITQDARREYTTTIRQCRKVLQHHSESRWGDDAIYLMAASYYGIGDYDSAMFRLEELETRFPESEFRADALFLAGLTRTKQREFGAADTLFDQVVREFPDYERKDEILFALAETAATLRDRPTAIRRYGELARHYPNSSRAEEALERAGQLHFEESNYDSAAFYFERLLERVRGMETEADAAILQAQALIRLDRADEALDLLNEVEPKDTEARSPGGGQMGTVADNVSRIKLEQAAALSRLGRHNRAIAKLREVASQQGSGRAIEAQFQIGYTYETLLDSLEAASAAYDKITTMSGRSVFKDQAVQRANALKSMAELQETEGSGDEAQEARADAALRIAEILYLDRDLIDEAIGKYEEVEEEFPESRAAPRAAYALAYLRWKQVGDSLGAQEEFRDLVARYPASSQARGAIDLLARQEADTSGLFALLVTPEPETLAVAADTAGATGLAGVDSIAVLSADSLAAAGIDSLGGAAPDSLASAGRTTADSLGFRFSSWEGGKVDSLMRAPQRYPDRHRGPRPPHSDSLFPPNRRPDRPHPSIPGGEPSDPDEQEDPGDRDTP